MPSAGGVVGNAVAILLVQVGLAAVALFVLADGPRRLRDNVGQVALGVAFLAAMAWTTWAQRWAWDNWGHGALAVVALAAAAGLCACLAGARVLVSSARAAPAGGQIPIQYEFDRAEDQWYVHDGANELGPFSTAELIERFANAEIASSHYLWKPGMDEWRRAYAVGLERGQAIPIIPLREPGNDPDAAEPDLPPSLGRRPG